VAQRSFDIVEPDGDETPVVVEVPHAGLRLDAEAANWMIAPARSIARDADLYVDELFSDSAAVGATLLTAQLSRYVVDLNRAPDDYDEAAVRGGTGRDRPRGVIWRLTSDGHPVLRQPISTAECKRRVDAFHARYHQALRDILQRKRRRFGIAVLLCAHSMPTPHTRSGRPSEQGADLVPGSRGRTSADARFIDLVERVGVDRGWRVQHDIPYQGGFTTAHYGRPTEDIHAVQIEIARRLYMDEASLARHPKGFDDTKAFARQLVERLVDEAQRQPARGVS